MPISPPSNPTDITSILYEMTRMIIITSPFGKIKQFSKKWWILNCHLYCIIKACCERFFLYFSMTDDSQKNSPVITTIIWLALLCHTLPILLNRLLLDSKVIPTTTMACFQGHSKASTMHPITTYIVTPDLLGKQEYPFDYCEVMQMW